MAHYKQAREHHQVECFQRLHDAFSHSMKLKPKIKISYSFFYLKLSLLSLISSLSYFPFE